MMAEHTGCLKVFQYRCSAVMELGPVGKFN